MRSIFFIIIFTIFNCLMPSSAQANALEWANGTWAIDLDAFKKRKSTTVEDIAENEAQQRHNNPLVISTDVKNMKYRSYYLKSDINARSPSSNIAFHNKNFLESHCDPNHPKANCKEWYWVMFFPNPDKFMWIRSDWFDEDGNVLGNTVARLRCPAPIS